MSVLGQTQDPVELVPGELQAVRDAAVNWREQAAAAEKVSASLSKVTVDGSWAGEGADQFMEKFGAVAPKWDAAADEFVTGANAVDRYGDTLEWAQYQAGEAITLWAEGEAASDAARAKYDRDTQTAQSRFEAMFRAQGVSPTGAPPMLVFVDPGEQIRADAQALLDDARWQLDQVGNETAAVVSDAANAAPNGPDVWELAGVAISAVWDMYATNAANGAIDLVNILASMGNAIINNPDLLLDILGGLGLIVLGAGGEVGGIALDATGIGAVGGIPLNIASAGAIAGGAALLGTGISGLVYKANGSNKVEPLKRQDNADRGIDRGDGRDTSGTFANGNKGSNGEWRDKEKEGLDIVAAENKVEVLDVKIRAKVDGAPNGREYDGLIENPDGTYTGVEIKSGKPYTNEKQETFDEIVNSGTPATARYNGEVIQIVQVITERVP